MNNNIGIIRQDNETIEYININTHGICHLFIFLLSKIEWKITDFNNLNDHKIPKYQYDFKICLSTPCTLGDI